MEKQMGGVDLHIHTTCSDGTRTVAETIRDAFDCGLSHIAITDHNQFAIKERRDFHGMEVIPGAEFSTAYETLAGRPLEVHVIGLFFDGVPKELWKVFHKIPLQRKQYLDAIITRLNHLGVSLSYADLENSFPDSHQIGRRHIAELLIRKKYAESVSDAFDRLIGNRSPYWVDSTKYMKYMPLSACVKVITENGGFPILAHPYHYHCTDEEVQKLIKDFKEMSGNHPAGMEVYYAKYDGEKRKALLKIAEKYSLFPSAASDRHDPKDGFEYGSEALLQAMKEALKQERVQV